ncbi:NAD-dependent epimerase/dehydratase family protein [Lewinella sp. IMCC34183]|uniref:NAD-dependent epimerase/dehydratase family protein n=1 Tax=Lewinella sp. IMCC34183 TaxID=2248762 RepID=UPI000E24044A|nr:NAD-dependent epimerase/dehydratase family protein [Lewinella sp. IMCC34183]
MPPDLLLTGATGFIGYYIARALAAAGTPFAALVRPTSDTTALEALGEWCTLRRGDVTDPESLVEALEGIDTVVHAAAHVSYRAGEEDRMLHVNAGGTANVVNMMLECGVRRMIYLSSVAALDRTDGGRPVTEADRWPQQRPVTAYARSKFAAEREAWRGQAEGLSVAALYPSTVLGAGDWSGSNTPSLWLRAATGAGAYPAGAGGFVDVRDVATAVLAVLERDRDRDRFVLSAANLTWHELLRGIAASVGATPPRRRVARWQSALLWPVMALRGRLTGAEPSVTRDLHRQVQAAYRYDGSAYTGAVGRSYIPVSQTLAETGQAFAVSRQLGEGLPPTYLPLLDVPPVG